MFMSAKKAALLHDKHFRLFPIISKYFRIFLNEKLSANSESMRNPGQGPSRTSVMECPC